MSNLKESTILVYAVARQWTPTKEDKEQSVKLCDEMNVKPGQVRVRKTLFDTPEYKAIGAVAKRIKDFHNNCSSPWIHGRDNIMQTALYFKYTEKLDALEEEYKDRVREFSSHYEDIIKESEKNLGNTFKRSDYPSIDEIEDKFKVVRSIRPVPDDNDFRVMAQELGEDEAEKIRLKAKSDFEADLARAVKTPWDRLYTHVSALKNAAERKATQEGARFHQSLIDNVRDILEILDMLNFSKDLNLTKMGVEIETMLDKYSLEDIKSDKDASKSCADEANAIMNKMAAFM